MSRLRCVSMMTLAIASVLALGQASAQQAPVPPAEDPSSTSVTPAIDGGAGPGTEAPASDAANPYAGDLLTRYRLSGDWWGARTGLAARGLTFDFFATQFYQGVASGGREQKFQYGGKLDYLFNLDAGKLKLLPGFFLNLHAETRFGEDVNGIDGLIAPSNLPMSFPDPDRNITSITGLKFTQALSEDFAVFLGKINTLDEYGLRYAPALGTNRPGLAGFMNTSLVFNPIVARTVPYSAAGTGFAFLRDGEPFLSLSVFDPRERATTGLDDLFGRGVVLIPDLTLKAKPFGRPGKYNLGGTWSSARYRSFDPAAYLSLPPQLVLDDRFTPRETGSWSLYANVYQSIWVDEEDEARNWGVFGQFGISDGEPNPIRFVANAGVGGRSMLPGRTFDTFGVGFFYLGLGGDFKALARPILPQGDEYGGELFYNVAITPWARFTVDLQVARPSTLGFNPVIIPGLRLQILF